MSVDLGKRKKIREGHRAYTRKLLDSANELLLNFDGSQSQKDRIQQLIVKYQEKLATLKELDDCIILLVADKHIEKEIEESEAIRSEIHEILTKLKRCLSNINRDAEQDSAGSPSVSVSSVASGVVSSVSSPKLPKLTLNKFNGDPKQWQEWWECFKVAIDDNSKLSDIEMFTYLRSLVEGNAESAIAGLPLTAGNYKEALEILQNRFAQKQVIINAHMDTLLNLEPVRSIENIKAARKVVDSVETHVRGLKALGIDSKQYGSLYIILRNTAVPILMDKLPEEIRLIISRKHKDNFELTELVEAAKLEIEARERCRITHSDSSKDKQTEGCRKPKFPQSTGSALVSGDGQNRALKCFFCEGNHRASDCTYVTKIEDRKAHLRKQGRCFVCLRRGHIARDCKTEIECSECKGRHHKAVCAKLCKSLDKPKEKEKGENNSDSGANTSAAIQVNTGTQVFLQTAQVTVTNPESGSSDEVKIRALFDTGAQRSYVSKRVADKLGLETVQTDNLVIATFGAEKQRVKAVNLVKLTVRKEETNFERNMNVYAVPKICSELKSQDIESVKKRYPHLNGIEFADHKAEDGVMEIDLLIGSDYMWDFLNDETIRGESGQPVAISTKVGWLLSGPVEAQLKERPSSINFQSTHVLRVASESPKEDLDKLWDFDSVGIRERGSVQEEFEQNINFKDGRYFVNLPWREHHELLPDNYENCVLRLSSTVKRLKKQPEVFKEYNAVIEDQERQGIIEKVDNSTIPEVGKVHYLPHHGVIRQQALSTKLRVVFDASSKAAPDLPSLNECLHVGPALSPKIFDILVRFRQHNVAIVADIEKAFLNVGIEDIDRDVLRFLWIDDLERDNPELLIYRFCRVVFGVNASPFLLNATLQNHIKHCNTDMDFAKKLSESFYVDDLVSGERNDEDAFVFCHNSKECLSKGGFHLRKWVSNSKELLSRIQDDRVDR